MGDGTELFRREALHAQTKHLIGEVVLYRPLSFAWLTLVSLVFAAAIIAFLALASYTRKEEKMVSDPNLASPIYPRSAKIA
jgi:membrane fusion protein